MNHSKLLLFVFVLVCLCCTACTTDKDTRQVIDMNTKWAFFRGDVENGAAADADVTAWMPVSLPHIMQLETKHCGGNSIYDGVGWYRRYFKMPAQARDKRVVVEFEGVMTNCEVYLNGEKITEHHGGYMGFVADITDRIDRKGTNVLAVRVSAEYDKLTPDDMVIVDLEGNKIEGKYNPSSDTATHVELYKAFSKIGGIVHTHSPWATSWAQAGRGIPCYGTTHADYMYGEIPCVRCLTKEEIEGAYEKNTGVLIADYFKDKDYEAVPAVLCKNHGPFTWGKDGHEAVHNAVVLEEVAKMAARCEMINPRVQPAPQELQDKHYYRKHGVNAYYGQGK